MKSELEHVSPVHKEIKLEIEAEEIKPVYDKVLQQYARVAQVPGFRKGYAPTAVVKNRYKDDINNDVLREILPGKVQEAIQEHELEPLSEPQLHLENAENVNLNGSESIGLHVHVEVVPELETPNYKGLEAVRRIRPVNDEDIDRIIESRRREQASLVPVEDRPAEIGDTVTVNINGEFIDDEAAEPIVVDDLQIELGGEGVEKTFTENLVGASVDEERTFDVEYPADFSSPGLAGKTVRYSAKVVSIGKIEIPEANDEWAASLSEGEESYESFADLRQKIRQDLETYAKAESDNRLRDELMNKLIDSNPVEVPPTLVNYQAQGLTRQFAGQMEQQGVDMRQADQKVWQMLFQRMMPQAEREVRGALLLDKIAEVENVEISDDEINAELEAIANYSGRSIDEVREALTKQNGNDSIRERLQNRRAIEILVENASITEGEWIDENEQTPEASENQETMGDEPDSAEATEEKAAESKA
ncbi:MAG: trigger factor [Acidobacteriota bacterium]|nr:trigger factor [Acidobacteriota bacterium]